MPATRQKPPSHAAAEWRAFAEASLASYDPELLKGVAAVDLWFSDLLGQGQHFSIPPRALTAAAVSNGIGYDGSSIRLSQAIHKSDMLVVPDLGAAFRDPVREHPTLAVPCWTVDPVTGAGNNRDPRVVASRAEAALAASGIADAAYVGPESEFFIFDRVSHRALPHESGFSIESDEAHWNHGNGDGRAIAPKRGYFPLPPMDRYQDLRTAMMVALEAAGLEVEAHHHEVATAGQGEIDVRYGTPMQTGDRVLAFRYILKNVAARAGKTVTFMPKPLRADNGTGMHVHLSLWKGGKPLFAGKEYAGLSELGLAAIAGIFEHFESLAALTNPTINSYRRLVPGYEAPVNGVYSARNRSAAIRIPLISNDPAAKRLEVRFPDSSGSPHLAFSALLAAAMDGIERGLDPGEPVEHDIYELPEARRAALKRAPPSLYAALDALEADHAYLTSRSILDPETVRAYIAFKRAELAEFETYVTPREFELSFDC